MVRFLLRMPIKVKLPAILIVLLIISLAGSGIIYITAGNTRKDVRYITTHITELKNNTLALERVIRNIELNVLNTFVSDSDEYFVAITEDSLKMYYLLDKTLGIARRMSLAGEDDDHVKTLEQLKSIYRQLYIDVTKILALQAEGKPAEARDTFSIITNDFIHLNNTLDSISGFAQITLEKKNDQIYGQTRMIQTSLLVFICVSVLFFGLFMFIIFRTIVHPIEKFNMTLQKISTGDLTIRFPLPKVNCSKIMDCSKEDCLEYGKDNVLCFFTVGSYAPDFGRTIACPALLTGKLDSCRSCKVYKKICLDEISTLEAYFNYFVHSLHSMMSDTKSITGRISTIADNLSLSSQRAFSSIEETRRNIVEIQSMINFLTTEVSRSDTLSEEVRKQAELVTGQITRQSSAVEKSSASIEQMKSNILSVAGSTEAKLAVIHDLSAVADNGKSEMKNTILLIREIASSTNVIQDMVAVIDTITSKTNLLAMNAAIEAAHAGNAGKGFSVVAGQIRKLAENTNKNSRQISSSLMNIIKSIEVSEGSGNKTGEYFDNIVSAISAFSGSIMDIKEAMGELSGGSHQITQALTLLLESSNSVLDSSNGMRSSVEKINKSLMDINTKSADINSRTNEITGTINYIYDMAKLISQAGQSNNEAVEKITSHLSHFKT